MWRAFSKGVKTWTSVCSVVSVSVIGRRRGERTTPGEGADRRSASHLLQASILSFSSTKEAGNTGNYRNAA